MAVIMRPRSEAMKCAAYFRSEYADTLCRTGEVLLSFSSGILTVVTFGTAYWLQAVSEGVDEKTTVNRYHYGLWQNCTSSLSSTACENLPLTGASKQPYF